MLLSRVESFEVGVELYDRKLNLKLDHYEVESKGLTSFDKRRDMIADYTARQKTL